MTNYNLSNIRSMLNDSFTDEDLRHLCFDMPEFRAVYDQLSEQTGKTKIVDRLIEHAERKGLMESLLEITRYLNPRQYEVHQPYMNINNSTSHLTHHTTLGMSKKPVRIIFLTANPSQTTRLRLDQEFRDVQIALRSSEFRDKFDLKLYTAVRIADLQPCLLSNKPHVVHFSGHGSTNSEIVLEDQDGQSQSVPIDALGRLFEILREDVRCVILNACYSEQQAQVISRHVDCVIGMSEAVSDSAAIRFSIAFYRAIGYGKSIRTAFDLGCNEIQLEGLSENDIPKLIAVKNKPEETFLA